MFTEYKFTNILVVGAGPAGLVTAIELARRGVGVRVVERAGSAAVGSRGDGLQPRTLEVFEDIGVLDAVLSAGSPLLPIRKYVGGEVVWEGRMAQPAEPSADVPYPNPWCLPQWATERILRERLADLGVEVEWTTELVDFEQDGSQVRAVLRNSRGQRTVRCRYLVAADGGHSIVRKRLGIDMLGETITLPDTHILLADVPAAGVDSRWTSAFGDAGGGQPALSLQPLPGTDDFVLSATVRGAQAPEPTVATLRELVTDAAGDHGVHIGEPKWTAVLSRFQLRVADRFRVGNVFLAGDAAHVHPPTGGQGLNTSVQDAYNLGWKLATVLGGAGEGHAAVLDSYTDERRAVALDVMEVSGRLLRGYIDGAEDAHERGPETQQLGVHYRGGPLSCGGPTRALHAGDRAPDALCAVGGRTPLRLFELLAGPHWTVLAAGAGVFRPRPGVDVYSLADAPAGARALVDSSGQLARAYGLDSDTIVAIRPDGYVGAIASSADEIAAYLEGVGLAAV